LADAQGAAAVRDLFAAKGVLPAVMGFPVEYRKDESTWREGLAQLPAQAKLAQALGCQRTATWITPANNERAFLENFKLHVERIGAAAAILADHGIALGLEFIGPKTIRQKMQHRFIYTMEGMLAMGAAMGTGNVGLLLDIWHLYTSHGSIDQVRELQGREVVVVHINDAPAGVPVDEQIDNVRTLPGETGVLEIGEFLDALHAIGYDGPVTVEPFSQRVREMSVNDAVAATAASVQKVWPQSGVRAATTA
jgi:sugar phosphate isomerase/epimerase